MLRGNQPATVDDKGRIKIPGSFRKAIRDAYGTEIYLTSLDGQNVLVYPLAVWATMEERINGIPSMNRSRRKLMDRVSYYGHSTTMDKQGRVLVPQRLRELANVQGEVVVMGQMDHLEVWNHEIFKQRLDSEPLSDEDFDNLAELGL